MYTCIQLYKYSVHNLFTICLQFVHNLFIPSSYLCGILYIIEGWILATRGPVESNSTESFEKFVWRRKNFMSSEKNFRPSEKNSEPIQKQIEQLGAKIYAGCIFYDLTPGGNHDMCDTFDEFINLLICCNEKKLYYVRDNALKNIKFFMAIE